MTFKKERSEYDDIACGLQMPWSQFSTHRSEKIGWKNHKPTRCLFVCLYDVINYLLHYLTSNMADICGTLLLVQSQLGIESASRSFWWERNKQQNKNKTQLFDSAKTLEILLSSSVGWGKRSKFLIRS